MKAKSIKGKTIEEVRSALHQCMEAGQDFTPTLAVVFMSVSQDRNAIRQLLQSNDIAVFGCTTNGEFIDENTDKGSIAMLLMDIKKDQFKIFMNDYRDGNYREAAKSIAQQAQSAFANPAFVVGLSHPSVDGEEILHGIEDVVGHEVNVFGAGAGDDYAFTETFVFSGDRETSNGMVCIALDEDKIEVHGIATCGWKAVGTEKTVTRSEGNHVYTVDNVPALDITAKYGGLEDLTPDNENLLIELAANFPLQLQRDKGDPVMRPGLVVDWSDHSFYTSGTVPQGSKVRFSLPPDWDVMEKVVDGVKHLKQTKLPEADALIVFSCAGRILSLGPLMTQEIEGIKNVWKVPMAGMFSNAELGRATGGNLEMHNLTTCCVALKEK